MDATTTRDILLRDSDDERDDSNSSRALSGPVNTNSTLPPTYSLFGSNTLPSPTNQKLLTEISALSRDVNFLLREVRDLKESQKKCLSESREIWQNVRPVVEALDPRTFPPPPPNMAYGRYPYPPPPPQTYYPPPSSPNYNPYSDMQKR